jgi:hypothetical protein
MALGYIEVEIKVGTYTAYEERRAKLVLKVRSLFRAIQLAFRSKNNENSY